MVVSSFTAVRSRFEDFCDKAADSDETVLVARKNGKHVAIISAERYAELKKAEGYAAFHEKLERGLAQVRAGLGIVKTMEELEAMARDSKSRT